MNKTKLLIIMLLSLMAAGLSGCHDDIPESKSFGALKGIYRYSASEYMEIKDLDWIYQYNLEEYDGMRFWIKRKLTYFYEPVSGLILRQDIEGLLQVDEVISDTPEELILCWVGTPLTEVTDEDSKFQIIQIFFKNDYTPDPANYRTYTRISADELKAGLGDIEVIEAY